MEGKGGPCGWHTNSSLSWSQRGRPQTGNHKSLQRPRCRNAVVCGGRAETGSLVFVNKNGERQGGEPRSRGPLLPALQPSFPLAGGLWGMKAGGLWAERCLLVCLAFLIFGTTGLWRVDDDGLYSVTMGGRGEKGWEPMSAAAPAGRVTQCSSAHNPFQRLQVC